MYAIEQSTGPLPEAVISDAAIEIRYRRLAARSYLIGGLILLSFSLTGINAMSVAQNGRSAQGDKSAATPLNQPYASDAPGKKLEQATFGMGCFWCSEAVFVRLKGVEKVVSGYSGGRVKNPTYEQVSTGQTGHAEVGPNHFRPGADFLRATAGSFLQNPRSRRRSIARETTSARSTAR